MKAEFCTCKNLNCNLHPSHHDEGCSRCIQICLKDGAIPSCFFRDVSEALKEVEVIPDSSYRAFAELALKK